MTRPLRTLPTALLLTLGLLLTGGCGDDNVSGDSNPDRQSDERPGEEEDKVEESPSS